MTTAPTNTRHVGDLIFVRPSAQDWAGQLVARATGGPYCHVRIRVSGGEVVEALARGITRDAILSEPDPADVAALGGVLPRDRCDAALAWLLAQVGDRYSLLDIAADAAEIILPHALGSRTPFLVAPHSFDCSHVAATFAAGAGYPLPLDMLADLPRVSPNSLARALGLLK